MKTKEILKAIEDEFHEAVERFDKFNTPHEGYAVMLEEMDELWDEIKKKKPNQDNMRKETIQIGAMAIRFLHDLL